MSWRAIYERMFERGPESFSRPERETIRAALEEAYAAGRASPALPETPRGPSLDEIATKAEGYAALASVEGLQGALRIVAQNVRDLAALPSAPPDATLRGEVERFLSRVGYARTVYRGYGEQRVCEVNDADVAALRAALAREATEWTPKYGSMRPAPSPSEEGTTDSPEETR